MKRNIGLCPFERYADDCIVHCKTQKQAAWVRRQLEKRFQQCGLTLHPVKTKIVDCRTGKESKGSEHKEFDFLGHTFRKRKAKNKQGEYFTGFLPAVSTKAIKSIQEKVKECAPLVSTTGILKDIAKELNPKIRGWFNSYGNFYVSELKRKLQCINRQLMLWARRKFKRLKRNRWKAQQWLRKISTKEPTLFEHWIHGVTPWCLTMKSRMTGDCHVRFCESLRLKYLSLLDRSVRLTSSLNVRMIVGNIFLT